MNPTIRLAASLIAVFAVAPAWAQSALQLKQENAALKAQVQYLQQQVSVLQLALQDATGQQTTAMQGSTTDGPAGPVPTWNLKEKKWVLAAQDGSKNFYLDPKSVRSDVFEGVRYVRADFHYKPVMGTGIERLTTESISYSDCLKAKSDVVKLRTVRSDGARMSAEASFDSDKAISDSISSVIARKLCDLRPR